MPMFIQKTPRCEAVQWTGSNLQQVKAAFPEAKDNGDGTLSHPATMGGTYIVPTQFWLVREQSFMTVTYMDPDGFAAIWGG